MENLTTEKKFLTEEEIGNIKQLNSSTQELIVKYGQIEYQLQLILDQKKKLNTELDMLKEREKNYSQVLHAKYGVININIETGEITPI